MPGVPRDTKALEQALTQAMGITPQTQTDREIEAYQRALTLCWKRMEAIIGQGGARAVVEHALKLSGQQQLLSPLVAVNDSGLDFSDLSPSLVGDHLRELADSLQQLYVAVLATLVELTGDVLVGPLLEELKDSSG